MKQRMANLSSKVRPKKKKKKLEADQCWGTGEKDESEFRWFGFSKKKSGGVAGGRAARVWEHSDTEAFKHRKRLSNDTV